MVVLAALLNGCMFTSLSRTHELSGEVRGLWTGAGDVTLRVTTDRESFLTSQSRNGEIAFARELPTGAPYTVSLEESPPDHACQVQSGATGIAAPESSEPVIVSCTGPDAGVTFDGPWPWSFDRTAEVQTFDGSVLTQQARLTLTSGDPGIRAERDGLQVALGQPSVIPLAMGTTTVTVVFARADGLSKTYQLIFQRGAVEPELVKEFPSTTPVRSVAIQGGLMAYAARATLSPVAPTLVAHERTSAGWSPGLTTALAARDRNLLDATFPLSVHKDIVSLAQGASLDQFTRTAPGAFQARLDTIPRSNQVTGLAAIDEDLFLWNGAGDGTTGCGASVTPHTLRRLTLRTANEVDCRRPVGHSGQPAAVAANDLRVFAVENGVDEVHVLDRNLNQETGVSRPSGISAFRQGIVAAPGMFAVRATLAANGSAVVEVFAASGTQWTSVGRLANPATPSSTTFAAGLALMRDFMAAGDPAGAGAVHLFLGAGALFAPAKVIAAPPAAPGFGSLVALSEDTLVVASTSAVFLYR